MKIINLREAPEFFDTIANRIWQAWWLPQPLSAVKTALGDVVAAHDFPFTLVAIEDGRFLGTVTSIPDDMHERPLLTPWIAALWVEPEARGRGIARALVDKAAAKLFALGHASIYLYCKPEVAPVYLALGWQVLESNIGDRRYTVLTRQRGAL